MSKDRTKKGFNWTIVLIVGLALIAGAIAYLRFVQIPKINQARADKLMAEQLAWEEQQRQEAMRLEQERLAAEAAIPAWQKIGASRATRLANCEWEKWADDNLGIEALISTCTPPGETMLVVEDSNLYEVVIADALSSAEKLKLTKNELRGGVVTEKDETVLEKNKQKLESEGKIVVVSMQNPLQYFWFEQATPMAGMEMMTDLTAETEDSAATKAGETKKSAAAEERTWQIEIDEGSIKFIPPAVLETATNSALIKEGI